MKGDGGLQGRRHQGHARAVSVGTPSLDCVLEQRQVSQKRGESAPSDAWGVSKQNFEIDLASIQGNACLPLVPFLFTLFFSFHPNHAFLKDNKENSMDN